jgi:hypothetical protein
MKEAWVLTQLGPTATQVEVGMTAAQVVTPHEVIAPTYTSTTGWQVTPVGALHVHAEQLAGAAVRAIPPAMSMLVPAGHVGGGAFPE